MKIAMLLKNGPCTDEAGRALQTADDLLAQGHAVHLYLLQEAARFCQQRNDCAHIAKLQDLTAKNLEVSVLARDAELRGIDAAAATGMSNGTYDSLVDLMASSDRVVGLL
jgi:sulfur relay (sulfurtransferase) complex TusBCD TusD component (DsrE family)